jgi:hypothetical protein
VIDAVLLCAVQIFIHLTNVLEFVQSFALVQQFNLAPIKLLLVVLRVENQFDSFVVLHKFSFVPLLAYVKQSLVQTLVLFDEDVEALCLKLGLFL